MTTTTSFPHTRCVQGLRNDWGYGVTFPLIKGCLDEKASHGIIMEYNFDGIFVNKADFKGYF